MEFICLAVNLPGPSAAARLAKLGGRVTKIEPPGGDPMERRLPAWYQALNSEFQVIQVNLKQAGERQRLDELLETTDLLLTSYRPDSLARLGLDWETLHKRYPRLCQAALLGFPAPEENRPGHDLTYQARLGLVEPPHLPRSLLADLAGSERAVNAALALLLARERGLGSRYAEVSIVEAAQTFADPLRYEATGPGGLLGGRLPGYGLYRAKEGWVAIAVLEEQFWDRFNDALGLDRAETKARDLQEIFFTQTAEYWESWACERDLPILAVREITSHLE